MLGVRIHHSFPGFTLDTDFTAPPGVTALFGRSGSGKTTVVNAVAGLLMPDCGRIAVGDWVLLDTKNRHRLPPHRRRVGYIFQEARLFPHLSVRQNLKFGSWFAPKHAPREDMCHIVDLLGIGHLLDRRPALLSGGEKQRVAIGRALLSAPRLILADEPLAALDEARKAEILPYFERLRNEVSIPILYVSHSPSEVARLATRVVVLDAGRVIRQGPAAEVFADPAIQPAGPREAGAFLTAHVATHHSDGLTELRAGGLPLFVPRLDVAPNRAVRMRIAAHDIILSRKRPDGLSALNMLHGTVAEIRDMDNPQSPDVIVVFDTVAGRLLAHITRRSARNLELETGVDLHAIIKTLSVAPFDIGRDS